MDGLNSFKISTKDTCHGNLFDIVELFGCENIVFVEKSITITQSFKLLFQYARKCWAHYNVRGMIFTHGTYKQINMVYILVEMTHIYLFRVHNFWLRRKQFCKIRVELKITVFPPFQAAGETVISTSLDVQRPKVVDSPFYAVWRNKQLV